MSSKRTIQHNIFLVCFAMLSLIVFEGYRLVKEYNTTQKSIQEKMDHLLIGTLKKYGQEQFISEMSDPTNPSFKIKPLEEDSIPLDFVAATLDTNLSEGLEFLMITSAIKDNPNFLTSFTDSLLTQAEAKDISQLTISIEGTATDKQLLTRKLESKGIGSYSFSCERPIVIDSDSHLIKMWGSTNLMAEQKGLILLLFIVLIITLIIGISFEKLIRQIRREQQYQKVNELYFFGLVHDLKTPLTYTKALLERIQITMAETDLEMATQINEGNLQVDRLVTKVDELLTIPKLTSCEDSDFEETYLIDIIERIEDELICTYSTISPSFVVQINADKSYCLPLEHTTMLLRILMDNAVRYSGESPKVVINAAEQKDKLIITVSDNGEGLPIHQKSICFTERTNVPLTHGAMKGHGVGLVTAIRIMNALGGCLLYEKTDEGSRFTIEIPIRE
ncbi:HAMP domain-containing sensor histidine kinase [Porphyromonadaceae bacterium W3.11]|nr:HAMP domain-containing sensor histidine kinase [Porphyromonadaceae bacterium W3.11]